MSDRPDKAELANEVRRTLNTLTDDAQRTAVKKFTESGLDPDKGKIPLQETLINLSQNRDTLLDAVETGKFVQLPLKIQYTLYDQVQAIARELAELGEGKDAILNLEAAVEDLTAAAWQFQLHNLSGQVLGFQAKMNQLKTQETRIREASRRIDDFVALHERATTLAQEMAARSHTSEGERAAVTKALEEIRTALKDATELHQKISTLAAQVEQFDIAAGQQLATAKQSSSDTEAIAVKSKEMRGEIDAARTSLEDLTTKTQQLLTTTTEKLASFDARFDELRAATDAEVKAISAKLDSSVIDLTGQITTKLEELTASADTRVTTLVTDASARLTKAETTTLSSLAEALKAFTARSETEVQSVVEKGNEAVRLGNEEHSRLVRELDELEGRIRTAIERATGFTLFHAFQERQIQIVKSKQFWARALGGCVAVAIIVAGLFVYHYRDLDVVTPSFFLKLSISIPMIYAIAFCNMQYSRERKLEEEYAFKSSVSLSLDPYQRLVGTLIDKADKEEMAKYTAFIIDSVNRVFTPPAEHAFEGSKAERTYAERIIKAVGGAIGTATDPLIKGLKRN